MTSYYSALFFTAFLPITVMLYGMAPRRFRWAVLLLASYGFFFALSGALIAFRRPVDGSRVRVRPHDGRQP